MSPFSSSFDHSSTKLRCGGQVERQQNVDVPRIAFDRKTCGQKDIRTDFEWAFFAGLEIKSQFAFIGNTIF